jgi:hypothetical protein
MSQTVYAYRNVNSATVMVEENALNFTGTWASTGTYSAAARDVANYGAGRFIAIIDSINVVPTSVPRRGQPYKWSDLVVVRPGVGTNNPAYDLAELALGVANTALGVANGAFTIAVSGTNAAEEAMRMAIDGTNAAADANDLAYLALRTAWSGTAGVEQVLPIAVAGTNAAARAEAHSFIALQTAWSGTAGVNQILPIAVAGTNAAAAADAHAAQAAALAFTALQTAWAGTVSYSEQTPWAGTMFVDLQGSTYQRIPINGDTLIEVINPSVVKGVTAILVSGTVANSPIRFTDGIIWFGQEEPDVLVGGQRLIVNFTSFGSVTTEIHAAYAAQVP